jgi:hypothetical protein
VARRRAGCRLCGSSLLGDAGSMPTRQATGVGSTSVLAADQRRDDPEV